MSVALLLVLASTAGAAELPHACVDAFERVKSEVALAGVRSLSWSLEHVGNSLTLATTFTMTPGERETFRIVVSPARSTLDQPWSLRSSFPKRLVVFNIATRSAQRSIRVEDTYEITDTPRAMQDYGDRLPGEAAPLHRVETLLEPCATNKDTQ